MTMTYTEAIEYIRSCGECDGPETAEEAAEIFAALYGRYPDAEDFEAGVWDLCCAAVDDESDDEDRADLVRLIEAAAPESPEQVADLVLTELDQYGVEAARSLLAATVWGDLTTPIFAVLDPETGVNVANAQCRQIDAGTWAYVDDMDSWRLMDAAAIARLTLVAEDGGSYRVVGVASGEVLSTDAITTYDDAFRVAREIEGHESEPEVSIQRLIGGEWVACSLVDEDRAETMTTYTIQTAWGETYRFRADLSQASAPIVYIDDDGDEHSTPYQTADAQHDETRAAVLLMQHWGPDTWLSPDCEVDEDEHGETTYDGMTERKYIRSLIVVEAE